MGTLPPPPPPPPPPPLLPETTLARATHRTPSADDSPAGVSKDAWDMLCVLAADMAEQAYPKRTQ